MKQIWCIFLSFIFVLVGCRNALEITHEYMSLDTLKCAKTFPKILTLKRDGMQSVPISYTYIKNFVIQDSLLFLDSNRENGLVEIISLPSMKSFGSYLHKGKASGEFLYGVNLTLWTTFFCDRDSSYAYIYDSATGRIFNVNFTKTISDRKLCLKELDLGSKIPRSAFWFKALSDSIFLMRTIDEMETHQNRSIITNKGVLTCNLIEKLNKFEIPVNEDFNILSSLISVSLSNGFIAEAMIGMNYINVYSLNGRKEYTICVGEKMDKLSDILSTSKYERKYMFAEIRSYSFGFAVLKYDVSERTYQMGKEYTPSILLFDWHGNTLGEIDSEFCFNHFDYDESKGELYVLDSENDLLKCKVLVPNGTKNM